MNNQLKDYISYRIQRAYDTLNDAKILADNGSWNSAINRAYYACFYAVTGLLFSKSFEAKTHKGVRIKFMKEFIKSGIFDKNFGKLYSDLFDMRHEGDYSDFVIFKKDLTLSLIEKSEVLITTIDAYIKSKLQ